MNDINALIARLRERYVEEDDGLAWDAEVALNELNADARRYRWLRDTLHSAVGGGVEVNDPALCYEKSEPGENVRVYWYPDTPVGFYEVKAETLDRAIDEAML